VWAGTHWLGRKKRREARNRAKRNGKRIKGFLGVTRSWGKRKKVRGGRPTTTKRKGRGGRPLAMGDVAKNPILKKT